MDLCLQGKYQRRVFSGICDKRCAPVLVEAATALLGEVISPDGGDGTEATRGLDVANHADHNHRWALNDGDSLAHFLLVCLGAWLVDLTGDVGHASLVASEGGEVAFLGCVILREGLDLTAVALATLAGAHRQDLWGDEGIEMTRRECEEACENDANESPGGSREKRGPTPGNKRSG